MTRQKVGYGKIGRSMPLTLDKCGNLGGDVEMVAVVKTLAQRHPDMDFYLLGRNTGENPQSVGLPSNVYNPWTEWAVTVREKKRQVGLNKSNLTVEEHHAVRRIHDVVTLPMFMEMDHIVMWIGQHGTTNIPLPSVKDSGKFTKPHDWCAHYVAFIVDGINAWREKDPWNREEIWLNADPRNYLKLRDLKWPLRHPVLAQYTYDNNIKHARYGDGSDFEEWSAHDMAALANPADRDLVWTSKVANVYSRLEINGMLPGTPFGDLISYNDTWERRQHFGLFINEARKYVSADRARVNVMNEWIMPLRPAWVHGTWSDESMRQIADANPWWMTDIKPAPWDQYYPRLHSVLATFTTPSSGSAWATAKPWEAFAGGTACFFHPLYDTQNNILGDAPTWLRDFLRVTSPEQLRSRVAMLGKNKTFWHDVITAQREHFDNAVAELRYVNMIEERMGL